jgi:phospholipase/carboxylesterase
MPDLNLPYRYRLPDSHSAPPAIVLVHGWLGNENVMWVFESSLAKGAALFSPRGPLAEEGGYGWYRRDDDVETFNAGLNALREFVTRLPSIHPVDPARIVLVGFSQGAAVSSALLLSTPNMIHAVAMLAGFLPRPARDWVRPGRLEGKAVFIAHGMKDETVPVAEAARAREALTLAGAQVTYGEYHVGHKMSAAALRALKAWSEAQTSGTSQPSSVPET